ncbi:LacI family DNA-binding transcriptional regulator [Streptomyces sp. DSM 42041]|uniref:LacI family DNA-binding transcriptional regulator n=1 Tax=Streptomyces hazeniae TaxID=3075538 RepID=A0ABU2NLD0_9ACTN|nr:LacI family DNA-binding transcriptional regulator [Streptomyces sp. DSM 42041]MDT0377776.1 LacI family DNA-binding transcriptional regulator [Streptomyces sp. DSM 42041]
MTKQHDGAQRRVTIRDVAQRAGVSISTVSHAMSGRRSISASTRTRIQEAAEALGYNANPLARSLRTGRSGVIGLILRPRDAVHGSLGGTETFTRLAGAMATAALEKRLGLIHVPDILDPAAPRVPMDGCIVAHPYGDDEVLAELLRSEVPVVTVDEDPDRPEFPWGVLSDHGHAATTVLDRLYDQGARRVLLLTGTEDNAWNRRAGEAYRAWAARHGLPPRHESLYEGEGVQGAERLAVRVLDGPQRPDAVVAAASRFASGVARTAHALGLRIPEDVMLASLTDSEYTRGHLPPITAVDLVLEDLAVAAVDLLMRRLNGEAPPQQPPRFQPVVQWRASTARR